MSLRLRRNVTVTDTEYGVVLLDEDGGEYWNLNPTGALVLRSVLDGGTTDQAARALAEEYDVEPEAARADAGAVVGQLRSAGLIEADGAADR